MSEAPKDKRYEHGVEIRRLDRALWWRVRAEAQLRRQSSGELVNEILAEWLARQAGREVAS